MSKPAIKARELQQTLREEADNLDKHYENVKISRITCSAIGLISSVGATASSIAIPFTMGASIAPAIVCAALGGVATLGSLTSGGASIAGFILDITKKKKAEKQWEELMKNLEVEANEKEGKPAFPYSHWDSEAITKVTVSHCRGMNSKAQKIVDVFDKSAAMTKIPSETVLVEAPSDALSNSSALSASSKTAATETGKGAKVSSNFSGVLQKSTVARIVAPVIAINALMFVDSLCVLVEASVAVSRKTKSAPGEMLRLAALGLDVIIEKETEPATDDGRSLAPDVVEKVRCLQSLMREAANKLDKHHRNAKKARIASGALGIVAGLGALASAIAIPITLGASIIPLITCASFAGSSVICNFASLGANALASFYDKKEIQKLEEKWKELKDILKESEELQKVSTALKSSWSWKRVVVDVAGVIGTMLTLGDAAILGFTTHFAAVSEVAAGSLAGDVAGSTAGGVATKMGTTTGTGASGTATATTETSTAAQAGSGLTPTVASLPVAVPLIAVNVFAAITNALDLYQATKEFRNKTRSDAADLLRLAALGLDRWILQEPEPAGDQDQLEGEDLETGLKVDAGVEATRIDDVGISFEQDNMGEDSDDTAPLLKRCQD